MAAPEGTLWGSIAGSGDSAARIGIYVSSTAYNTYLEVNVSVYFWSKYSVSDSNNNFYFNNSGSATTSRGSRNISTTTNGGSGWSTNNQKCIYGPVTYKFNRTTSAQTEYFSAKLSGVERVGSTMYAKKSITVAKLKSYTITYNNNGGTGGPGSQTKWYGKDLKISSTTPTRTGHSFLGWGTSASDTTVNWKPGDSYTTNASDTLYAIWKANTYTITYNNNGGTGGPGSQTKTYGKTLTISSIRPTRTNYNFLGWSTSSTGSVVYKPGDSYTTNASDTLYAVWGLGYKRPRINNFTASRCDQYGNDNDTGTSVKVSFTWSTDKDVTKIITQYKGGGAGNTWTNYDVIPGSGRTGTVKDHILSGDWSNQTVYTVRVCVTDSETSESTEITLGTIAFPIDVKAKGTGIAFGKVAEKDGIADFGFKARFQNTPEFASGILDLPDNLRIKHNTSIYAGRTSDNTDDVNLMYSYNGGVHVGGGSKRADRTFIYSKNNNVGIVPANDAPADAAYTSYFYADKDGKVTCGTKARRWYRLYATSATVQTSDRREKENIIPLGVSPMMMLSTNETSEQTDIHSELFDRLQPVQYNFIDGNKRTSFGLIAQDVIESLNELGIEENTLDLVHHDKFIDEETGEEKETFGIAYENLIALLIHEVQKLKKKIK